MKKLTLYRRCSVLITCLIVTFVLAGCAGEDKNRIDQSYDKWKTKAEESKGYSPSVRRRISDLGDRAAESADAEEGAAVLEEKAAKTLPDSPVSLNMSDVDVAVLLRSLARAAGQNIMINEKVTGRANINIRKAPWNQVFLGVLKTHGLSYQWEGDIIRIMTAADVERDLQEAAQKIDLRELEPLTTRIIRIDYAEAAKLKTTLQAFLTRSKKDDAVIGSIMVDDHTNTLIVQALKDDIENMIPLVEKLDLPTPQILIEAHIVEATSGIARELGIEWGGKYQFSDENNTYTFGGDGTTAGSGVDNTTFSFPASIGAAGMTLGFLLDSGGENVLNAQLTALEAERKLKILSSPSITTIDNKAAVFKSGEEIPYQSVDDGNVKVEFKEAVLLLNVTPHVIDGEAIKLEIKVKKDEPGAAEATTGVKGILTKQAETNVILYDGQTTVIGGLNKTRDERIDRGVPGLRNLPVLGVLFRGEVNDEAFEDLLIFITPHILKQRIGGVGIKSED